LRNIFAEASTSGTMINSHLQRFYEHISGENVDSWAGHKDSETMKLALPSKYVNVLPIPEKTTKCLAS
jgi:hypothetical protein